MVNGFQHAFLVFLNRAFRIECHACTQSLRHALCFKDDDVLVLGQFRSLSCGHDDVAVVRQDENMLGRQTADCLGEVLCCWIHGLSAADDDVSAVVLEQLHKTISGTHGDDAEFLLLNRLFFRLFLLLCTVQDGRMLLKGKIVDLNAFEFTIALAKVQYLARQQGIHAHLDLATVIDERDVIAKLAEAFPEAVLGKQMLALFGKIQDELGTVAVGFDFLFLLFFLGAFGDRSTFQVCAEAIEDVCQTGTAGVNNSCLLQHREKLRCTVQACLGLLAEKIHILFQSAFRMILDIEITIFTGFTGNGKDGSFRWTHDSLVCLDGTVQKCC